MSSLEEENIWCIHIRGLIVKINNFNKSTTAIENRKTEQTKIQKANQYRYQIKYPY